MTLSTRRRPLTALLMAVVMAITSLPIGMAHAGMVSTQTIIDQQAPETSAATYETSPRERIRDLLARDDVHAEMVALGITPAEAEARIAALTDQEIAAIAGRLDELPAGEGVGTILIVIFIVFGVAVLLDALGMMNIFPFVCGPGECGGQTQQIYSEPVGPPPADSYSYGYEEPRTAYRRDSFQQGDRRQYRQDYDANQYYEPQPQPRTRNYFDERYGSPRQLR